LSTRSAPLAHRHACTIQWPHASLPTEALAIEAAHPVAPEALIPLAAWVHHPIAHHRRALPHHALLARALEARALRAVENSVRPRPRRGVRPHHLFTLRAHFLPLRAEALTFLWSKHTGAPVGANGILHLQHPLTHRPASAELLALD
jgi:hypothetical protein